MRRRRRLRALPGDPAVPLTFDPHDFPAEPYPGARPDVDFVQDGGVCRALDDATPWLADPARRPLLAYGSNACPAKIEWLRTDLGLPGAVVVLRVRSEGLAAVWAAGLRVVDDQRPATLTAMDGVVEQHAVWLVTAEQLAVLDVCEGRGTRYRLATVRTGAVHLAAGRAVEPPLAYVGCSPARMPLLVDGRPVRCADVGQAAARGLVGVAAPGDGLDAGDLGTDVG